MIDGNWVDIATLTTGAVAVALKPVLRWQRDVRPIWVHRDVVMDFLNGAVLFPFLLMIFSAIYSQAMDALIKQSKISLALAGVIGMLFLAKEICSITNGQQNPQV